MTDGVTMAAECIGAQSMPVDLAEHRLIQRATAGSREAFEQLYHRHVGAIYGLSLRLCAGRRDRADDTVQETFVAAWRGLNGFRGQSQFGTWLHRIAVNTVLQADRTQSRWVLLPDPTDHDAADRVVPDALPPIDVERAVTDLPDGARHVLVLVALYGFSHAEVAQMLGIAEGTSKAQLNRARQLLTERLARGA